MVQRCVSPDDVEGLITCIIEYTRVERRMPVTTWRIQLMLDEEIGYRCVVIVDMMEGVGLSKVSLVDSLDGVDGQWIESLAFNFR